MRLCDYLSKLEQERQEKIQALQEELDCLVNIPTEKQMTIPKEVGQEYLWSDKACLGYVMEALRYLPFIDEDMKADIIAQVRDTLEQMTPEAAEEAYSWPD